MEIYFLRHGDAEDKKEEGKDEDRPLTSKGAAVIRDVCRKLKGRLKALDLIITSPMLRARQTADIAANVFKCGDKIKNTDNLLPAAPPSTLLEELASYKEAGSLLLVGHQPQLGECIAYLTGARPEETGLKKGGCALVSTDALKASGGRLIWLKSAAEITEN